MTAIQPPLAVRHRNPQLFSDYYLDEILPRRADWGALAGPALAVMETVREIFLRPPPPSHDATSGTE